MSDSSVSDGAPLLAASASPEVAARTRYRLCATVWHAGTASSGHYVADVRRSTRRAATASAEDAAAALVAQAFAREQWQRFDDAFVRPVAPDAPDAATKGYIFFYVHDSLL